jgi:Caudovirus prohead serine protease
MTKHVSPEIAGTELIGTYYIRADDGAVMRDDGTGRFVRYPRLSAKEVLENSKHSHRPVMSKLESLEQAEAESPKNVSLKFVQAGLEGYFKSDETDDVQIGEDRFIDGKRRGRKPGGCHPNASTAPWRNIQITKKFKDDCANEPCLHFRFRNFVVTSAVKRFRCTVAWTPARRQFRDIVKSDWFWLFWQVRRYVGRAPFLADIGGDTVPEGLRDTTTLPKLQGKLAINTTRGADAYNLLKMRPRPAYNGLSIGYIAKDFDLHKNGSGPNGARRTLKSVDLKEISVVTFPADKFSRVSGVKSWLDTEPVDEAALAEAWAMAGFEEMRRLMNNHRPR